MSTARGSKLAVTHLGLASCLRVGIVAGLASGVVVFVFAFLLWELLVPGVEQTVGSAFAGSQALVGSLLGPGTGLAVAALLAVLAAVVVVVGAVLVPLFYDAVARRTPGIGVVLVPERADAA
jgi:hypothetical protein